MIHLLKCPTINRFQFYYRIITRPSVTGREPAAARISWAGMEVWALVVAINPNIKKAISTRNLPNI